MTLWKIIIGSVLILLSTNSVQAQYTIPDPAFAAKLQIIVPYAMNGNDLDTLHSSVLSLTEMDVSNGTISDLSGVSYFTALETLWCGHNDLTVLPRLPGTLIEFSCSDNDISNIQSLPAGLLRFYCEDNDLVALPSMPTSLNELHCGYNQLTALPILPNSLTFLTCSYNWITQLLSLPNAIVNLQCMSNSIDSISQLPVSLVSFRAGSNQLSTLPDLPLGLEELNLDGNLFDSLPPLPSGLEELWIKYNQFTVLPQLPSSLQKLIFADNQVSSLPVLPASLTHLEFSGNPIDSLPSLPSMLVYFFGHETPLTELPELPSTLEWLDITDTQVACLPTLPNSLRTLHCLNNPVNCLPNIPTDFELNYSYLDFPLAVCNVVSPCAYLDEAITGTVFHDDNANGIMDVGEAAFTNAIIEAQLGDHLTAPDLNGKYLLPMEPGSFVLDGGDVQYHLRTTNPSFVTLMFADIDSLNDVGYQAIPGIYDLVSEMHASDARPGFDNMLWVQIENIGTESTLAAIDLTFDNDQTWISSDVVPDSQVGNSASWSAILAPGDNWNAAVQLHTDQAIPLGTAINHQFVALPQLPDTTPVNNATTYSDVVVGSFDPNDKIAEPTSMTPLEVLNGDNIEYTINFQNTGTYPAERVVITDTLSSDLDWSSMEFISSSHANMWYLQNGVLHFVHDPIFLPDSNSNEPESHGYVKFRMKPVSTLMAGDQIENVANIYFDFNESVITDPAIFEVSISTEISEFENAGFEMYPNPTNGNVTIVSSERMERVQVLQLDGRVVRDVQANSEHEILDLQDLSAGTYIVLIRQQNGSIASKLLMLN